MDETEEAVVDDEIVVAVRVKGVDKPCPPTNINYDLQLDLSVLNAIQNSLASTPHQGFKPVVSIGTNGNVKIDFIPL